MVIGRVIDARDYTNVRADSASAREASGVGRRASANGNLLVDSERTLRAIGEHNKQEPVERERQQTETDRQRKVTSLSYLLT